jgi:hypothetical protein
LPLAPPSLPPSILVGRWDGLGQRVTPPCGLRKVCLFMPFSCSPAACSSRPPFIVMRFLPFQTPALTCSSFHSSSGHICERSRGLCLISRVLSPWLSSRRGLPVSLPLPGLPLTSLSCARSAADTSAPSNRSRNFIETISQYLVLHIHIMVRDVPSSSRSMAKTLLPPQNGCIRSTR